MIRCKHSEHWCSAVFHYFNEMYPEEMHHVLEQVQTKEDELLDYNSYVKKQERDDNETSSSS